MEKYRSVGNCFLRKHYLPHLLVTALLCLLSVGFVSFRNLSPQQAAKVMEMYAAFTGILLFTPLFLPEQDREIWLLEESKAMPLWHIYLLRVCLGILALALVITGFLTVLWRGNSEFAAGALWIGSFSEILFLGSIGFFVSGVTNQAVLGYMVSILYFMGNIGAGSRYLGKFALFQMMKGNQEFVPYMLSAAVLLIATGIGIREKRICA